MKIKISSPPNFRHVDICCICKFQGYDSGNAYCEKHQILVDAYAVCDDYKALEERGD